MNLKNKDPFGGVHGESESSAPSPFKIDKDEAILEINKSLDIWDKKKVVKKSFLQTLQKEKNENTDRAPHWEFQRNQKNI